MAVGVGVGVALALEKERASLLAKVSASVSGLALVSELALERSG